MHHESIHNFFRDARRAALPMCLVIVAHQAFRDYPLVVAANRDEYHARATRPSQFWPTHPDILAGRDEELGGTWMGVTRSGRFAAITNYRDPSRTAPAPRSRGELPLGFLAGSDHPRDFLQALRASAADYAGFNLLLGGAGELWYYSNSEDNPPEGLAPGIYGLSNAHLDTPWPKSELGKQKLAQLGRAQAAGGDDPDHEQLTAVVADRRTAPESDLHPLGLESEMEQLLSAQFIVTEGYGTRSCTTMWLSGDRRASWREQSYDSRGGLTGVQREDFSLTD